jgi:transposase
MESMGVYWKPVWNLLKESFTLILANAKRIKNVPGRKTDVGDAAWIAPLLRCGLITSSFVPRLPFNFQINQCDPINCIAFKAVLINPIMQIIPP